MPAQGGPGRTDTLHLRSEVTIVYALLPASVWAIVDGLERAGRALDPPP